LPRLSGKRKIDPGPNGRLPRLIRVAFGPDHHGENRFRTEAKLEEVIDQRLIVDVDDLAKRPPAFRPCRLGPHLLQEAGIL